VDLLLSDGGTRDCILEFAAKYGRVSVYRWLAQKGLPYTSTECQEVLCTHGHLAALQWLHGRRALQMLTPDMVEDIVKHNHANVLEWALYVDVISQEMEIIPAVIAIECGHTTILDCLKRNDCAWDVGTWEDAAERGHLHVLQWAARNGAQWDSQECANVARAGGHAEIVDWIEKWQS
jgi:hypothetical protein